MQKLLCKFYLKTGEPSFFIKYKKLYFLSFFLIAGFSCKIGNSQDKTDWYKNASLFINIDTYPRNFEAANSPTYREEIKKLIRRTKATMIYYHCSSQDGYTKYQSEAGIEHPNLGDQDMVRIWREVTREMGVKFFAYVSYHMARAELEAHPEFRRINRQGNPIDRPCSNSDYVDTYVLPKLEELVTHYDIDGLWLDASIWAVTPCYCTDCVTGFKQKHGLHPPKSMDDPMWTDFARFQRESFEEQSKRLGDLLHKHKPECIYVPNYAFTIYQPEKVRDYVDAISGDVGHDRRTQMVSFKSRFSDTQGVPWDIMLGVRYSLTINVLDDGKFEISGPLARRKGDIEGELQWFGVPKSAEYLSQESAIIGANGGIVSMYVHTMWNSALSPYRTEVMGKVADFNKKRLDVYKQTEPVRDVGILHSASTFYNEGDGFSHLQPALDRLEGAHVALIKKNYHVNLFADYDLDTRLNEYRVVVLSQQTVLTPEAKEAIRNYVKGGGSIVVAGKIAMNEIPSNEVSSSLEDVLGIRFLDKEPMDLAYLPWRNFPLPVNCDWYPVETTTAETFVPMLKDRWAEVNPEYLEYPAMTVNRYGQGKAVYISGDIFTGFFRNQHYGVADIIEKAMVAANDNKPFETDAPISIEFSLRKKEDDKIVHMINRLVDWDMDSEGAIWSEHIPPVGPFKVKIRSENRPVEVLLKPSNVELEWIYDNGFVNVTIPGVHIHEALVLKEVL